MGPGAAAHTPPLRKFSVLMFEQKPFWFKYRTLTPNKLPSSLRRMHV